MIRLFSIATTRGASTSHRLPLGGLLSSLLTATFAAALLSCGSGEDVETQRAEWASDSSRQLVVAAPWPWEARKNILYGPGMDLALAEIEARGGVLGRDVRVLRIDDQESINEGRVVAHQIAQDPRVVAVIGHLQSAITLQAADVYDRAGLVLVAPSSSDPELTQRGFTRVFRTTFSDDRVGAHMAEFAAQEGHRRAAISHLENGYGRALAGAFERQAASVGLDVVSRLSFDSGLDIHAVNLDRLIDPWLERKVDAVFLAADAPIAPLIIARARERGFTGTFYGGDGVGIPELISLGKEAVEGTVVPSRFDVRSRQPEVRRFVEAFRARYGVDPDVGAATAYDALHLWAHAVEVAGNAAPDAVAHALRNLDGWRGVTGVIRFDERGEYASKTFVKKRVESGRFAPIYESAAAKASSAAANL